LGIPVLNECLATSAHPNNLAPAYPWDCKDLSSANLSDKSDLEVSPPFNAEFKGENFLLDKDAPFFRSSQQNEDQAFYPYNTVYEWEDATSSHDAVDLDKKNIVSLGEGCITPSASALQFGLPATFDGTYNSVISSLIFNDLSPCPAFNWTTSFQDGSGIHDQTQANNSFLAANASNFEGNISGPLHSFDDVATLDEDYLTFPDLPIQDFSVLPNFMAQNTYAAEDLNTFEVTNEAVPITNHTPPGHGVPDPLLLAPTTPTTFAGNSQVYCSQFGCPVAFKRDSDRIRHEASVHGLNQVLQLHLCPIAGCLKSQGAGYTRKDKLTEHMWRKHADLGYVKRVL
jgi:hypothetical protein